MLCCLSPLVFPTHIVAHFIMLPIPTSELLSAPSGVKPTSPLIAAQAAQNGHIPLK